jgi:putative transposase
MSTNLMGSVRETWASGLRGPASPDLSVIDVTRLSRQWGRMRPISFARHRFPPEVIRQAVWLYFRFTLSFRDVEDLMAARGIEVSYEAIRCWTLKFGTLFARNLRRARPGPTGRWHLDEMVVRIGGRRMYLWRAVDNEGEVLDMLVQTRRNKRAARKLLRKLLKNQHMRPESIVTDGLTSYGAAISELGCADRHRPGRLRKNNRAENSHLPIRRRERKQQRFKSRGSAQRFLAIHAAVHNTFNVQRHLIRRPTLRQLRAEAEATWTASTAAA